jgi:ribosome-associated protein
MAEAIVVTRGVVVPAAAWSFKAVRGSGPGGQNVNKVASKVELRVQIERVLGLTPDQRARLARATANARGEDGRWIVVSQRTRDQFRNLEDAREKVRRTVERALVRPRPRRATGPTPASKRKLRLAKSRRSEIKRVRGRVRDQAED